MAVEVEATSQLDEFLGVLKRRVWAIVLPATLISAIGISIAIVIPKKYVSSTRVMLRDVESDGGGGSGEGTSEGRVAEHTIRSPARVRAVLKELAGSVQGWKFGWSVLREQVSRRRRRRRG